MNGRVRSVHRRDWLRSALVAAWLGRTGLGSFRADADPIERIKAKGRDGKMQPFEVSETTHFVGVGDAPAKYRLEALGICEAFAADYFAHFRAKGFTLDWPSDKLPVVILASSQSYAAFEQAAVADAVGGHYDLEANWLVTFDFRPNPNAPQGLNASDPRLDNTLSLVHETFHQLSYNTGMLDRKADIPLCLTEGLATYAETWRPTHKGAIGAFNARRRRGLELGQKEGVRWIPVETLLSRDEKVNDEKTEQVAYAESSMLVTKLLKDPARLPRFRDYLQALQKGNDPGQRVPLAKVHLGDLNQLDRDIRR